MIVTQHYKGEGWSKKRQIERYVTVELKNLKRFVEMQIKP